MSSAPGGVSFKEHSASSIPRPLALILASSAADTLPSEEDITQLKKEVDDFYTAIRRQANRYQRDLETLSSRHGTADQARRRDVQKNTAAQIAAAAASKHEEGINIPPVRYPANAHRNMYNTDRVGFRERRPAAKETQARRHFACLYSSTLHPQGYANPQPCLPHQP